MLKFSKQRASGMVEKVIRSRGRQRERAGDGEHPQHAVRRQGVGDPGRSFKRFQPKDRGKAYPINKRTSHLVVTIDQREDGEKAPQPFKSVGRTTRQGASVTQEICDLRLPICD
jgi:large subunit ribosomal protein L22